MESEFSVTFDGTLFNISEFLKKHPGGSNYIKPYQNKEISKRMKDIGHSKTAYKLLEEFKINNNGKNDLTGSDKDNLDNLIDLNKPILDQIGNLGDRYEEWIMVPTTKDVVLSTSFINYVIASPWYFILIFWLPVISYCVNRGLKSYFKFTERNQASLVTVDVLSLYVFGLGVFWIAEYIIHRFIFHYIPSDKNIFKSFFRMVHCSTHGFHHKAPFNPYHVVASPYLALVTLFLFYKFFILFLSEAQVFLIGSGIISKMVVYELIHAYCHLGTPKPGTYLYEMKRHHLLHHYKHSGDGYGVTSVFWDNVFGTAIKMKKLAIPIKWE